jgi:hypothetical protein
MARSSDIQDPQVRTKPQKAVATEPKTASERTKGQATKTGTRMTRANAARKTGQMKGTARGARPASLKTAGKSTAAKKGTRSAQRKTR